MDGEIVGVDLSTHSIAQDFVGSREGVHLVQADLFNLPFAEGTFDNVFSIGVLHHTPETRAAFRAIVPYVKPGGQVSIWVYHPEQKRSADRWRVFTTRLPHPVLYSWCVLNQACLSWVRMLPGGGVFNTFVPGSRPKPGRHFWHRVLSDFDNLSPKYAHTHTENEVVSWFHEAGLTGVEALERRTAVTGFRSNGSTSEMVGTADRRGLRS